MCFAHANPSQLGISRPGRRVMQVFQNEDNRFGVVMIDVIMCTSPGSCYKSLTAGCNVKRRSFRASASGGERSFLSADGLR